MKTRYAYPEFERDGPVRALGPREDLRKGIGRMDYRIDNQYEPVRIRSAGRLGTGHAMPKWEDRMYIRGVPLLTRD